RLCVKTPLPCPALPQSSKRNIAKQREPRIDTNEHEAQAFWERCSFVSICVYSWFNFFASLPLCYLALTLLFGVWDLVFSSPSPPGWWSFASPSPPPVRRLVPHWKSETPRRAR